MSFPYHADHPNVAVADETASLPDLPDLQQEDPSLDVKGQVEVVNLVRVQQMPSRHGVSAGYNLAESVALALLTANPRRKRAVVIGMAPSGSTSLGFYVGERDSVQARYAALWPYNVPLVLENTEQVYVMPNGTGLAAGHLVSVISEDWAD